MELQKYKLFLSIEDVQRMLKKMKAAKKPIYYGFIFNLEDNSKWTEKDIKECRYKLLSTDPIGWADYALSE